MSLVNRSWFLNISDI